jgi:UDP:flavonoid glycosyltransferase YjiC (YdhE family)
MVVPEPVASPGGAWRAPRRFLVVATNEGGGDIQPLLAIAAGLLARGHAVVAFGDDSVPPKVAPLGIEAVVADPALSLGAQYAAAAREDGDLPPEVQGERIRDRLIRWSGRLAPAIEEAVEARHPDVLLGGLFGSGPIRLAAERRGLPWVGVNSSFYIGPSPPRAPELEFGPRTPLFRDFFAPNLDSATLVLHASDREFDFGFDRLPPHHRYAGPLFWDPPGQPPAYLDEPGDPWALVSLSSHTQDDAPIARASLAAFEDLPLRTLLTVGAHADAQLGPVPANARVERFVPHGPVLERAALMVGHAGHGSVMRALWHGVPMILVPWGRDQGGVAARAEHLGVAAVIPRAGLTTESLGAAARRVLGDRAMADRLTAVSERLRARDPVAEACSLIAAL